MKDQRTDQELNRIIAEWIGWTVKRTGPSKTFPFQLRISGELENIAKNEQEAWSKSPRFCTDLNAIHEAEDAWISKDNPSQYEKSEREHLLEVQVSIVMAPQIARPSMRATARQRAEALVAVIENRNG